MHAEEYAGLLKYDTFSAIFGKSKKFALSVMRIGIDDIPLTKLENPEDSLYYGNRPYKYRSVNNSDIIAYFGLYRNIGNYVLGITPKIVYRNLADDNAYGFGADISTNFQINSNLKLSVKLRDIFTTHILWSNSTHEFINPSLDYELRYDTILPIVSKNMKLFFRNEVYGENRELASNFSLSILSVDYHIGAALDINQFLDFYLGYEINNFTTGFSFSWKDWKVNYSFQHNTELENSQRLSLGYSL